MTRPIRIAILTCTLALLLPMALEGCGGTSDGPGGTGGDGGNGGTGGTQACDRPEECDDLNECTDDTCDVDAGTCSHIAVQDDSLCSLNGTQGRCRNGICEPAGLCTGVDCDDENECTIDTCNPVDGSCQHRAAPDDAPCDFGGLPGVCFRGRCEDAMLCLGVDCDDKNECTIDSCDPQTGLCDHQDVNNETPCADDRGTCQQGLCSAEFACTEQGIRDAVELGGGPHTFDCNGPTVLTTQAVIWIGKDVILDGEGVLTLDGDGTHRIFFVREPHVALIDAELRGFTLTRGNGTGVVGGGSGGAILNGGTLVLVDTIVSGNTASEAGGGIFNGGSLILRKSTVSSNQCSGRGGGIYNSFGGPPEDETSLQLVESTVSGNTAASAGGGVFSEGPVIVNDSTISGNTAEEGGGFYQTAGQILTLFRSTVSGNNAQDGGGVLNYQAGVVLTNSTLSGNVAQNLGGAIFNRTQSTLAITNGTLSDNEASMGSAIFFFQSGEANLINTIVDGACNLAEAASHGHNIESPGDTCGLAGANDQTSVTPVELDLGPLQDNGGPTLTQLPDSGSAALDAAICADLGGEPVTSDQRGLSRPQGAQCDIGAVEVEPAP